MTGPTNSSDNSCLQSTKTTRRPRHRNTSRYEELYKTIKT